MSLRKDTEVRNTQFYLYRVINKRGNCFFGKKILLLNNNIYLNHDIHNKNITLFIANHIVKWVTEMSNNLAFINLSEEIMHWQHIYSVNKATKINTMGRAPCDWTLSVVQRLFSTSINILVPWLLFITRNLSVLTRLVFVHTVYFNVKLAS